MGDVEVWGAEAHSGEARPSRDRGSPAAAPAAAPLASAPARSSPFFFPCVFFFFLAVKSSCYSQNGHLGSHFLSV